MPKEARYNEPLNIIFAADGKLHHTFNDIGNYRLGQKVHAILVPTVAPEQNFEKYKKCNEKQVNKVENEGKMG